MHVGLGSVSPASIFRYSIRILLLLCVVLCCVVLCCNVLRRWDYLASLCSARQPFPTGDCPRGSLIASEWSSIISQACYSSKHGKTGCHGDYPAHSITPTVSRFYCSLCSCSSHRWCTMISSFQERLIILYPFTTPGLLNCWMLLWFVYYQRTRKKCYTENKGKRTKKQNKEKGERRKNFQKSEGMAQHREVKEFL